ncbi:hypothetical protein GQX73_g6722 [Xylaria multiplex]|uniref:Uncharacterized protein n=1 Tax=Xylaria multiplex TaxID=323545 RepID=A0A7C8N2Q7_9PEZI|nr:hypothetical protein GQX73_g6722 [Xylaria multiplex]
MWFSSQTPHGSLGVLLLSLLFLPSHATLECRPPGPVVPKPRYVNSHPKLVAATRKLTGVLEGALAGDIHAGWPVENTSFSIGLIMHDQGDKAVPVWEYHHLAPGNINGTRHISRDSQYLVGSISKVVSDYILLRSGLGLDESIATFLPELADEGTLIAWKSITLRHLATQVAGIPPNCESDGLEQKEWGANIEEMAFQSIIISRITSSPLASLTSATTQFLKGMVESYPVAQPGERPVYSNIAFTLLMYAVEARTGKNYSELLEAYVTEPLGLRNTVVSPGDDDKAVIPPVDNSWGSNYGDNAPGGGLVSSLSDLSIFVHGILSRTIFDSDTAVREWLKPTSSTGSLHSLVGTPWEIYRTGELTPDHPHVVDIYAKGGAAYGYQAQMAVLDEYGAGIVLLTAGSALATPPLYDAILTTLVPALDEIAREQAMDRGYTGLFVDCPPSPSSNEANGSISFNVTVVQDQDSLVLLGIERNGTDILASLREIWSVTIGGFLAVTPSKARIFPIDIRNEDLISVPDGTRQKVVREDWRVEWELALSGDTDLPGAGLSAKNCLAWTLTDWMYYGSEPIDRIVFVLDAESGDVIGLEIPYLRSGVLQLVKTP